MPKQKIKVGLIYGGKSFEHDVSKMTAVSIEKNIDRELFEIIKIYINKKGEFDRRKLKKIDVAFLAVHGPNCEDGKLQIFLDKLKIKYTGSKAKASAINMNKILMRQYFKKAKLKTIDSRKIVFPCFVKPNNTGSSIGISKANNKKEFEKAISLALRYDQKIIIEKAIENPREIEIAVLGNKKLILSEPGEILTRGRFYSYEAKYFHPFKTTVVAKKLSRSVIKKIKKMAVAAYRATGCSSYARVDFFIDQKNEIYINEINTLPGFTKISMFPKMMKAMGVSYKELITKIILLALE